MHMDIKLMRRWYGAKMRRIPIMSTIEAERLLKRQTKELLYTDGCLHMDLCKRLIKAIEEDLKKRPTWNSKKES